MSTERSLNVLRAPRVSEKTARLQEVSNQYVFEVAADATKADVKAAVEQLFDVKVEAVNVVNVKGKSKSFRSARVVAATGARRTSAGRRPDDRRDGQGLRKADMALMTFKPTSPGRRSAVRVVTPDPAQGCAARRAGRGAEQDRRPQPPRPHHHPPHRWWPQAALPHHRLQARQGRHPGARRADRVRPEPHRAHRAAVLRRRRAPLHHRAEGLKAGDQVIAGRDAPIKVGNTLPLRNIPSAPRCTASR
jgi:large subunit ribosomal protein L23